MYIFPQNLIFKEWNEPPKKLSKQYYISYK